MPTYVDGQVLTGSDLETDFGTIRAGLHVPLSGSNFVNAKFIGHEHIREPLSYSILDAINNRFLHESYLSGTVAKIDTIGVRDGYQVVTSQLTHDSYSTPIMTRWTPLANACFSFEVRRAMNLDFRWFAEIEVGPDYATTDGETRLTAHEDRRVAFCPFISKVELINTSLAQLGSLNIGNFNTSTPVGPKNAYALSGYHHLGGSMIGSASSGMFVCGLAVASTVDKAIIRKSGINIRTYTL
jgi:hypothetical protein